MYNIFKQCKCTLSVSNEFNNTLKFVISVLLVGHCLFRSSTYVLSRRRGSKKSFRGVWIFPAQNSPPRTSDVGL